MTPVKFIAILDSFPAAQGMKRLERSMRHFCAPAFQSTIVEPLLSWPLARGRKGSNNLLKQHGDGLFISKCVESASFLGSHDP